MRRSLRAGLPVIALQAIGRTGPLALFGRSATSPHQPSAIRPYVVAFWPEVWRLRAGLPVTPPRGVGDEPSADRPSPFSTDCQGLDRILDQT